MKTKTVIISVLAAVAVAIGVTTVVLINQPAQEQSNTAASVEQAPPAETQGENVVSFTAEPGKTVLDQLKTKATVEVKESSFGPYVDSINGKVGGTDNKYWSFYIDGQLAQVGAAEYTTTGGELIEWKFE